MKRSLAGLVILGFGALFFPALGPAQTITSAHSGTVHYFEGDVSIEGQVLVAKPARFPELKLQEVLRTGQGRAELLLTPGVFLRVAENSAVRMLDNRLLSTRVEVVSGSAMVESEDPRMSIKDSPVTLVYRDYEVRMVKHGLVEVNADPAEVKVFKGEAEVSAAANRAVIKEGRLVPLAAGLVAEKFDAKTADDLYLWARDRSESLSAANMASARSISSSYADGGRSWNGGWYYNPHMSMFTYVPAQGSYSSPFGFGFFSPAAIYSAYSPVYSFYGAAAPRGPAQSTSLVSPVRGGGEAGGMQQLGSPMRSGAAAPGFGGGIGGGTAGGGLGAGAAGRVGGNRAR